MTSSEKKLVKKGIVIPVIFAIFMSVIFVYSLCLASGSHNFSAKTNALQSNEVSEITSFDGEVKDNAIKKSALSSVKANCVIGTLTIEDSSFPLIYGASSVNALGKFNIDSNGALIGEVGVCSAEVYKNDSAKLKLLTKGDIVTADTFYSSYEYKITDTFTADSEAQLKKAGAGTGRALVLYTDNSVGAGIGTEYYVCVAKMISGADIDA